MATVRLSCLPTSCIPAKRHRNGRHYRIAIKCAGIAEPSGIPAPMGQKTEYKDGWFEKAFMSLFARKMEKFASGGKTAKGFWDWDYESFVDVSRRVMVGRNRQQQQEVVREVLLSMLPPGAPAQVHLSCFVWFFYFDFCGIQEQLTFNGKEKIITRA